MIGEDVLPHVVAFIRAIGIDVIEDTVRGMRVPGLDIRGGAIVYDASLLNSASDLLHEAAHIALTPAAQRAALDGWTDASDAEELMAIAWSWAAARALEIPAETLFHDRLTGGQGDALRENVVEGRTVGVPGLQRYGLTCEPNRAAERGLPPYPHMVRWLRE